MKELERIVIDREDREKEREARKASWKEWEKRWNEMLEAEKLNTTASGRNVRQAGKRENREWG